jgi:hypothetical protein
MLKESLIPLVLLGVLTLIPILVVYIERDRFPSLQGPENEERFQGTSAWAHLLDIAQKPHPVLSPENERIYEYLLSQVEIIKNIQLLSPTSFPYKDGILNQIIAYLPGSSNDSDTLLLSAHFDSVEMGPGASDNSAGVTVALQILKRLAAGPKHKNSLMVFLNNG